MLFSHICLKYALLRLVFKKYPTRGQIDFFLTPPCNLKHHSGLYCTAKRSGLKMKSVESPLKVQHMFLLTCVSTCCQQLYI